MPINVDWNNKSKTLIQSRFADPWTVDQLIEARKAWHRMIKSMDRDIPIALDLSDTYTVPKGALRHLAALQRTPHSRQDTLYVCGLNPEYEKIAPFVFCCEDSGAKRVVLVDSIDSILDS